MLNGVENRDVENLALPGQTVMNEAEQAMQALNNKQQGVWNFVTDATEWDTFILLPDLINQNNINSVSKDGKFPGQTVFWRLCAVGQHVLTERPELLEWGDINATPLDGSYRGESALFCLVTKVTGREILAKHPEFLAQGHLDTGPVEGRHAGKTVLYQLSENEPAIFARYPELLSRGNLDAMALEGVDKGQTVLWHLAHDPVGRTILAKHPEILLKGNLDAAPEEGILKGKSVLFWLASTPGGRAILAANPEIIGRANLKQGSVNESLVRKALESTEEGRAIMQQHLLNKDWLEEVNDCLKKAESVAAEIRAAQTTEVSASRRSFFSKSEKISQAKVEEMIAQKAALEKQYIDIVGRLSNIRLGILSLSKNTDNAVAEKDKSTSELRRALVQVEQLEKEVLMLKEAKERAEEEMEFWGKHLNGVRQELHDTVSAHHDAKTELALRSAELKRNDEDLRRLNADIVELAELAEQLQDDKEKYYTESQYGYMRRKCDELQKGRDELLKRAYAAEKEAGQAVLKVEFKDSSHRLQVEKLKENISDLNEKIRKLQGECATLKSGDRIVEIEELKAQLVKERARTFSTVLESFDSAAAAGVVVLQKKNDDQQTKIQELEAKLHVQEALPLSPQITESKLAKNIKRVAIGAGFILAAVATVAALGFLGAVAVTYALPLLAIGLVIAAGGTAIAHLTQSKHEDRMALEAITSENFKPGFIERTVLTVKSTMEKAVSETAQTVTPV